MMNVVKEMAIEISNESVNDINDENLMVIKEPQRNMEDDLIRYFIKSILVEELVL